MFNIPNPFQVRDLCSAGWIIDNYYMHKRYYDNQGDEYEIEIEFCMGDNCVGLWSWKYDSPYNLIEPKIRCMNWDQVLATIHYLTTNYKLQ